MNYSQLIEWFEDCASIGQMDGKSVRFECDWVDDINKKEGSDEVSVHYPYIHLTPPKWTDDLYSPVIDYQVIFYVITSAYIDENNNVKRSFPEAVTEVQSIVKTYLQNLFNIDNQIDKYAEAVMEVKGSIDITPSEKLSTDGDYFLMVRMTVSSPTERC